MEVNKITIVELYDLNDEEVPYNTFLITPMWFESPTGDIIENIKVYNHNTKKIHNVVVSDVMWYIELECSELINILYGVENEI